MLLEYKYPRQRKVTDTALCPTCHRTLHVEKSRRHHTLRVPRLSTLAYQSGKSVSILMCQCIYRSFVVDDT
jgi:hypothetical protein